MSQASGSFLKPTLLQKISPGQTPVIPANVRNPTGIYKTQLALSKPVSQIPSKTIPATEINNILNALILASFGLMKTAKQLLAGRWRRDF